MCGICGEIRFSEEQRAGRNVPAMLEKMASRGPDGSGSFIQGRLAFGQRRLKIIDLTEAAQQPMIDNQLGLGIVYNGAIYNYRELRQQLQQKGYHFFSEGDTEVLLKAYHAWGENFVQRLQGMFAFAIWERESQEVLLGRDRLGIKPLYYSENNRAFQFASNLPALLSTGEVNTEIDPVGLHHYMTFHAVIPPPHTILRGVKKLPPASLLRLKPNGETVIQKYWELEFSSSDQDKKRTLDEWKALLREALMLSVGRRLVADVPVGVLLSGGLDSSLVVGLLAKAGQQPYETFSIGFEAAGGEKGDEFEYSNLIAEHFGTKHHRIEIEGQRVFASMENCFRAMSEPMVSHDVIGFYLLSEVVSKHIKVVQSGQGADEVFGSYHWYPPLLESQDLVKDYAHVFFDRTHEEYVSAVNPSLVEEDFSLEFIADYFRQVKAEKNIDKALHLDTSIMLVDDPVKRVDNMTMGWGLEARVPFLDHELVELAARIPPEFKVARGGKYVLKETARGIVPDAVIDRPKGYFPVPALKYIQGPYLEFVHGILKGPKARERQLFNSDYVDGLLAEPEKHITPLRGSKLWQLTVLEYWMQTHGL